MNQGSQNEIKPDSQDTVPAGDADSNRKASEIDYRKQVSDLYLKRRAKGFDLTPNDEQFLDVLLKDDVPILVALDGINQAFDKFKPKHKKDEIRSLSYCEGIIYGLNAKRDTDPPQLDEAQEEIEDTSSQNEYQRTLEKLRSKRGVGV